MHPAAEPFDINASRLHGNIQGVALSLSAWFWPHSWPPSFAASANWCRRRWLRASSPAHQAGRPTLVAQLCSVFLLRRVRAVRGDGREGCSRASAIQTCSPHATEPPPTRYRTICRGATSKKNGRVEPHIKNQEKEDDRMDEIGLWRHAVNSVRRRGRRGRVSDHLQPLRATHITNSSGFAAGWLEDA